MKSNKQAFLVWSGVLLLAGCQPSAEVAEQESASAASTVSAVQTSSATQADVTAELPAEIQTFYQELAAKNDTLAANRFILNHATPDYTRTSMLGQQETRQGLQSSAKNFVVHEMKSEVDVLQSRATDDGWEVTTRLVASGVMAGLGGIVAQFSVPIKWSNEGTDRWVQSEGQWKLQNSQLLKQTSEFQGETVTVEADLEPVPEVLASRRAAVADLLQPLPTLQFAGDLKNPDWLAPYGEAQIVGLGEGSHGTEEIHQLKAQLFKQLALHHGFTVLTFEADPGYVYKLNRWVQGESNEDLKTLFNQSHFNFTVKATYDLLTWMREQNAAGQHPPFEVWGLDVRTPLFTAGELYRLLPEGKAKRNAAALIQLDPEQWDHFVNNIDAYAEQRQAIHDLTAAVAQLPADTPQLADIQYLSTALEQFDKLLDAYTAARNPEEATALSRSLSLENEFMARNAKRVIGGKKGAIWAHNGHVEHSLAAGVSSIGTALDEQLEPNQYQVICSSLGQGEANALEASPGPGARWGAKQLLPPVPYQIDGLAAAALSDQQPAGYLSLEDLRAQPDLREWLSKGMNFSQIGLFYSPGTTTYQSSMNLESCDGYIFVKESSPSKNFW